MASSDRVVPGERLTAWERWELGAIAEARAEEQRATQAAKARAETIESAREEGYRAGFEAGRRDGEAKGLALAKAESARLAAAANAAEATLEALGTTIAGKSVQLALAIARQVLRQELSTQPEAIVALVREALEAGGVPKGVRVLCHPDDAALIRAADADEIAAGRFIVAEDPRVARGGCRLVSEAGELDATLETRWKAVEQLFSA